MKGCIILLVLIGVAVMQWKKQWDCVSANYDFGAGFVLGSDIQAAVASNNFDELIRKRNSAPPVTINGSTPTVSDPALVDPSKPYFVGKLVGRCAGNPEWVYKLNTDCVEFASMYPDFIKDRSSGINEGALIQKYGIDTYLLSQNLKC